MWRKNYHTLAPPTKLFPTKVNFKSTDLEKNAFMSMNKTIGRYFLPSLPNFSEEFIFHKDDSKTQLGSVISQNRDPIAFYSLKLTHAQINYTPTEQELLDIVETLK